MFIDWRQLPSMTDALQWAGWVWRGILVWDKTNSRPQRGRFRQQAEFVVWGSNGHMPLDRKAPVLPGVFRQSMPPFQKRIHQTEKPLEVMRDIVKIVEPGADSMSGGIILDPFAGAGTTVLAAMLEGYPAVGIELSQHYAEAAAKRIEEAANGVQSGDEAEPAAA
jgi:site-specific DNA-methyltransferase (adenine-specific)